MRNESQRIWPIQAACRTACCLFCFVSISSFSIADNLNNISRIKDGWNAIQSKYGVCTMVILETDTSTGKAGPREIANKYQVKSRSPYILIERKIVSSNFNIPKRKVGDSLVACIGPQNGFGLLKEAELKSFRIDGIAGKGEDALPGISEAKQLVGFGTFASIYDLPEWAGKSQVKVSIVSENEAECVLRISQTGEDKSWAEGTFALDPTCSYALKRFKIRYSNFLCIEGDSEYSTDANLPVPIKSTVRFKKHWDDLAANQTVIRSFEDVKFDPIPEEDFTLAAYGLKSGFGSRTFIYLGAGIALLVLGYLVFHWDKQRLMKSA